MIDPRPAPSGRQLVVAALQMPFGEDRDANISAVARWIGEAAGAGAQIVLPPELFDGPYFCQVEDEALFARAFPLATNPAVEAMRETARRHRVAIPTSVFERDGHHHYNTLVMVGPDGSVMGHYRKSHIPDGPGYEEKYYFRPGNTGFRVWELFGATVGIGVCWDQWYPETARAMALLGAEVLFYPTAIGSEPYDGELDTARMWRRAMVGHAVCNCMPVVAANRVGREVVAGREQTYYGTSFITDEWGDVIADADRVEETCLLATLDLDQAARHRAGMGFFRDRRPDLYGRLAEDR